MSAWYDPWHIAVLALSAFGIGLWTGFLIGRDWRAKNPRPLNTARGGHPPPPLTPEIRRRLSELAAQERAALSVRSDTEGK